MLLGPHSTLVEHTEPCYFWTRSSPPTAPATHHPAPARTLATPPLLVDSPVAATRSKNLTLRVSLRCTCLGGAGPSRSSSAAAAASAAACLSPCSAGAARRNDSVGRFEVGEAAARQHRMLLLGCQCHGQGGSGRQAAAAAAAAAAANMHAGVAWCSRHLLTSSNRLRALAASLARTMAAPAAGQSWERLAREQRLQMQITECWRRNQAGQGAPTHCHPVQVGDHRPSQPQAP